MNGTNVSPRIYVASLSDYNAGVLHGAWIDASQDAEQIEAEIAAMLRESKHPNVEVDCPNCNYDGAPPELIGRDGQGNENGRDDTCPDCNGSGKVPSAEEWAIHDFEGFEGVKIDEHESIETVAELAAAIEEHGPAFAIWWENENRDDVDVSAFQDAYQGEWDSLEEYVENYWDDCGDFNAQKISGGSWWHPANYIDWERMAHDLERSGDIWSREHDGKVYVFNNC